MKLLDVRWLVFLFHSSLILFVRLRLHCHVPSFHFSGNEDREGNTTSTKVSSNSCLHGLHSQYMERENTPTRQTKTQHNTAQTHELFPIVGIAQSLLMSCVPTPKPYKPCLCCVAFPLLCCLALLCVVLRVVVLVLVQCCYHVVLSYFWSLGCLVLS